jgi:hypothetical protein
VYEGIQQVTSGSEFDLLVKIKQSATIGAISLGFYYPEEYLEINGAELANGSANIVYNAENGLFRMAWCDLNPLVVNTEESLVVLHMKAKDLSGLTGSILLTLFDNCEIADPMAYPIEGITISIPEIQYLATGINDLTGNNSITVHPNPFSGSTFVTLTLANEGRVKLSLYDMTGTLISNIAETDLPAGSRQFVISAEGLTPGIYMLKTVMNISGQDYTEIVKVVVSR